MTRIYRPRRLRTTSKLRNLVAETRLHADMFVQPHFIANGSNNKLVINSMPGIYKESIDVLTKTVEYDLKLGINSILLFGTYHKSKNANATDACDKEGLVPKAVFELKKQFGDDLLIITDVCLCAYTNHGHCGILDGNIISNDSSLLPISTMALRHAEAGADIVAPSDMMDSRVLSIRELLDKNNYINVGIMSYAVKYASGYYGPFREAADSAPSFGDRRSYQMDSRNVREAIKEALLDVEESADILMVKPALAYLDVIHQVKQNTNIPLSAYNVSGEYSMVKLAVQAGYFDERTVVLENLLAITRAGADILITYHARDVLSNKWL